MKSIFNKYISIESILIEIDNLKLPTDQHQHLVNLVDNSMHHAIMDAILSNLSPEDKKIFLHHMQHNEDKEIMDFLDKRIDNIEDKIKQTANDLVKELQEDIMEAKRLNKND